MAKTAGRESFRPANSLCRAGFWRLLRPMVAAVPWRAFPDRMHPLNAAGAALSVLRLSSVGMTIGIRFRGTNRPSCM